MSSRLTIASGLLALGLLSASAVHAETSGTLTLTSDYLFRGITQTNEKPPCRAASSGRTTAAFTPAPGAAASAGCRIPVSYTHLTLPTKRIV